MSVFGNLNTTMDPQWGFATGTLADGNQAFGRSVGYTAAATLNTIVAVRGTTYTPQTTAAQRSLKSSSTSDATGGTGAITVTINYLNNSMQLKQDTVTLNGTTAVNTNATDIQFIESMVVATCGSNLANIGTISLYTTTAGGGTVWASIAAEDNTTFYAHHYVPAGVSCYVSKHTGAATLASGRTYLVSYGDPRSNNPIYQVGDIIIHLAGGSEDHEYSCPLIVAGPNWIVLRENPVASATNNEAYGSFDWIQD
jgi:hypothetical protein